MNLRKKRIIPSIKITFYLAGKDFDLERATQKIGIIPTRTRTRDSFPLGTLAYTTWEICVEKKRCAAVSILFEELVDILSGKSEILCELCKEYDLETNFEVVIHMQDGDSPEVVLSRKILFFATSINAEIGFDLYCYE
ncbi:MAG: DUF4279 domain-containing protein [Oscillospiraceae bacterium]|nr:DUF4279 domain-containing protein [Oscillospiraceae bacterium]